MSVDMKQAIELSINDETNNYDFSNEQFQEMNKYNDFLLSQSIAKFSSNNMSINQIPKSNNNSNFSKGAGGCPFLNKNTFRDIETLILPHYEMQNLIFYPYDFFFDLINYKTKDLINKSKKIRNIPKFIRNTLFLNDETIKRVRKMNFNQSFIVGEQLKENTEKIYKEGNYYEALQQYNLIYSLFRWLEFKDKTKEETLLKDVTKISDMPIIDDDIILKRCAVNNPERRRKQKSINNCNYNGTIDDSVSYDSDDEKEKKNDEDNNNMNNIENKEDENNISNISDNFIKNENEESESSEGEEEEDDEEEENEKSKESLKNDLKENKNKQNKKINKNENKQKEKNENNNNNKNMNEKIIKKEKIENKNNIKEKEIKKEEEQKNEEDEIEELYKYDLINFRKTMQLLLKRMGYCYIHLCSFSEAIECFNEAFKYVDDECPDFYFRRAQAKIYNKNSNLKDLKNALGDLNKALSRKVTFHSEILLREHKLVQELISKKEEQICLIPIKLLDNFRYAMNKIKKNHLNIQDYIINNNELDETHYLVLKEIKEIYFYSIKHILKKKDHKLFEKKISEYDNFLDKFYIYEEYYNFDVNNITIDVYRKLNTQQQVDIELLKHNKTLRDLLNELKYKKCEEIFDNLQINENMYLQAFKNVMEIQRIEKEIKTGGDSLMNDNDKKGLNSFVFIWNKIINSGFLSGLSQMMRDNFYFLSISLIVLCLTIIASQINQNDNNQNK